MTTNAARRQKQHKIIAEQAALIVELRAEVQRLRAAVRAAVRACKGQANAQQA